MRLYPFCPSTSIFLCSSFPFCLFLSEDNFHWYLVSVISLPPFGFRFINLLETCCVLGFRFTWCFNKIDRGAASPYHEYTNLSPLVLSFLLLSYYPCIRAKMNQHELNWFSILAVGAFSDRIRQQCSSPVVLFSFAFMATVLCTNDPV